MLFWKKKKSRKNTYKNNVFPRYVDKMAGEFDVEKFNCGICGKNGGRNAAVPAAGETTILSENVRLSIHDEKTHLNNNMSFIIADTGGKILAETRAKLVDAGYDIQILDVSCPETSAKYNPLQFVKDKEDTEMLARCIAGNDFAALSDAILRVLSGNEEEEQTMANVAKLIAGSESGMHCMNVFLRPEITNLTERNDIILDKAGERLTGIFVVCPEEKSDADMLANIMMMQLHRVLVKTAKEKYNGERLSYLTRLYFNHIDRYGSNPFFVYMDKGDCFRNVRRYNIAYTFACLGLGSVKKIYGEDAGCIFANTDAVIYCNTDDEMTARYIYRKIGVGLRHAHSRQRGVLIDPVSVKRPVTYEEFLALPEDECYIMLRGHDEILDKKYSK